MSLTKLPLEERPRERLLLHGPGALSLSELLAIIIGKGTRGRTAIDLAHELLSDFGGLHHLMNASVNELSAVRGIGSVKAVQIKAVFELAKRLSLEIRPFPIAVKTLHDIANVLRRYIIGAKQEHLFVICLNIKGHIVHIEQIGKGTLASVLIHPREVFAVAVSHSAAQIALAHNHPSGNSEPSQKDIEVTRDIVKAGELMQIPVIEHFVLSEEEYSLIQKQSRRIY